MRSTGTLVLRHQLASAAMARRHVTEMLYRQGVSPDRCDDAALVVSELVGNALRHARPRADGTLGVRWRLVAERLEVEVSDGGGPTDPQLRREPESVLAPSGRGLAIIDVLAEQWGVRRDDDGTTVWATIAAPSVPLRPSGYADLESTG